MTVGLPILSSIGDGRRGMLEDGRQALMEVAYASAQSPLGPVWIGSGPRGLLSVDFCVDELEFVCNVERRLSVTPVFAPEEVRDAVDQFGEYFTGQRLAFDLPVDLENLSAFHCATLRAVQRVPYGRVSSYGDIARAMGKPGATRAVGTAVATNPIAIVIPCHRIVRGDGTPGEYAYRTLGSAGRKLKLRLLTLEGVTNWDEN
ncbi:MAG: methylated-DNA--[protein]-cysteine S-methyltransferase [Chloroflexota bacterium]